MREEFLFGLLIGLAAGALVTTAFLWLLLGSPTTRFSLGRLMLRRVCADADFAKKAEALLDETAEVIISTKSPPPPPAPITPPKPDGKPLWILTLLQAEARFIDFLFDDLSKGSDAQISAVVKEIHPKAQATLKKYLEIKPVMMQAEGESVLVPAGFDPSAIQVTGNVQGQAPYTGTLRHAGWRVETIKLTPPAKGVDELILQPAEVEVG